LEPLQERAQEDEADVVLARGGSTRPMSFSGMARPDAERFQTMTS
jgi:hypothetical protein